MPRDRSILLVANARPFEIGKLYFFRDHQMRRLVDEAGAARGDPPSLRRWTEPSAWLEIHSKSTLVSRAPQGESGSILPSLASAGPAISSENQSTQRGPVGISAELSDAIAGINAEARRASHSASSGSGEDVGFALKELMAIAEKIRKGWSAA